MPEALSRPALAGVLALAGLLAFTASAAAAPIAVHLRVEGANSTLFDGAITTDARSIVAPGKSPTSAPAPHPCDFVDNAGYGPSTGTPTSALYDAATQLGLPFAATWYGSLNDFFVDSVGSETGLGYAVNFTTAPVGGCEFQLSPGSDVLWAADYINKVHLLKLTAPASANAGASTVVNVIDGSTGQPVQGASVGSATTDAGGNAALSFPAAGQQTLKAERADSVRSAALSICVHSGNDGTCGTTAPNGTSTPIPTSANAAAGAGRGKLGAPVMRLLGVINGRHYRRGRGPRVLHGFVTAAGPLKAVRLRLTRRAGGKCSYYSGRAERFVSVRCGKGFFFTVATSGTFSYLLPDRLGSGHYSLQGETIAVDGTRDNKLQRGRNWSIFDVG